MKNSSSSALLHRNWQAKTLNIGLFLVILLLSLFNSETINLLRFDRVLVHAGEWWRLFTCHFVHLNGTHASLNLLGLGLVILIFHPNMSLKRDAIALFVCIMGTSLGIYYLSLHLQLYVGFSGVLHGYFIYYLLISYKSSKMSSLIAIVCILLKVLWEQSPWGDTSATEALIGGVVAIDAHLYGVLSGLLAGLVLINTRFSDYGSFKNP